MMTSPYEFDELLGIVAVVGVRKSQNLPDPTNEGVEAQPVCVGLEEEGPFFCVFFWEHPSDEPRVLSSQQ